MSRVLSSAYEEVPFWDLTPAIRNCALDGTVNIEPAISQEDAASALEDALGRGDVTLYDRADSEKRDIALSEALTIVRDADYWSVQRAPTTICLFLTDAGMERLSEMTGTIRET